MGTAGARVISKICTNRKTNVMTLSVAPTAITAPGTANPSKMMEQAIEVRLDVARSQARRSRSRLRCFPPAGGTVISAGTADNALERLAAREAAAQESLRAGARAAAAAKARDLTLTLTLTLTLSP